MTDLLNAFSVDVEDYYHVSAFEKHVRRDDWGILESRVERNTHRMLAILDRHNVKATFFVLGWVAERFPQLVREIRGCGHEIGSHTFWHRLVYDLSPDEFRADLCRSRDVLQDLLGEAVTAFRAPSFSITRHSLWALEILAEEGFRVDSSIFPIRHDRCGIPEAPLHLHQRATPAGPLWEFPLTVFRMARLNVPVGGGGYFRFYPLWLTVRWLRRINRAGRPFVFYVHPWEIDPEQPRFAAASPISRFRHYVNLSKTENRLDVLLGRFRFGRLCDVLDGQAVAETSSGPLCSAS